MATLRKLASETVIYGLSSIVGRFINWLMIPLYTTIFQEPNYPKSEYGIQTKIMAFVAVISILLTYGMETGYFRFISDKTADKTKIYNTIMTSLLTTSLLFVILILLFTPALAQALYITDRTYILPILGLTLAIDAYCSIPFARLRAENRPMRFAIIKLINIGVNVGANLFFFLLCPYIFEKYPNSFIQNIYNHDIGIGYVFISFFLASFITLLLLFPLLKDFKPSFEKPLVKKIIRYTYPIMLVGLVGQFNLHFDKMAMDKLLNTSNALDKVAEYGAVFRLGVLMTLFTQAYRYAFEPFFFKNKTLKNAKELYADALKYFFITGLFGFLAVVFYIDWIALLLGKSYREGIYIVPYILLANLALGVYYSLSVWYKLTDKTIYGAYMATGGTIITIGLNILLVPRYGYIGAAYAFLISAITMTICSYILGQRIYKIPYQTGKLIFYLLISLFFFILSQSSFIENLSDYGKFTIKTCMLILFVLGIVWKEPKLRNLIRHE